MATNVVLPEGFKVVSKPQAASLPEGFKVVQMGNEAQSAITPDPEILAKVKANNEAYANRPDNRPWVDKNPVGRLGVAVMQGIANAGLNPAGYIARAAGMDTRPFEPKTIGERIGELAGQYGFDAATIATGLGGAAEAGLGGTGVTGNVIKTMAQGGVPLALTGSTGSAILTGTINPQNPYARMFTDLLGGGVAASMSARPKIQIADRNDVKAIKQIASEIGQDALDENMREAQRTGRSLLEVGSDEVIQAAQEARQQTPEARKIFNERIAEIAEAQPAIMRGAIDDALGTQGKYSSVAKIKQEAYDKAQPLFDEVRNRGDLATEEVKIPTKNQIDATNNVSVSGRVMMPTGSGYIATSSQPMYNISRLSAIVKENDVVADAIKKVKQSYSSLKKLPDTDANVLIEARRLLSEQSVSPNTTLAFQAKTALKEFDPIINNVTGGKLAQANRLYQDAHQYERAADLGRDVFSGRKSVEDFNTNFNGLSDMEKTAARIGLRDELLNKIGSSVNESVATKKFLPQNVREKMATIAGKANADKIIDAAEQSVKSMRNINKFIGGSQTSEKQRLRDVVKGLHGFIRHPWDKTVDAIFNPLDNARNVRMAQYLTDPNIVDAYNNVLRQQQANNARIPLKDIYLQNLLRTEYENR